MMRAMEQENNIKERLSKAEKRTRTKLSSLNAYEMKEEHSKGNAPMEKHNW